MLVTSMDPLRIHIYNDGLARFCTSAYVAPSEDNVGDLRMHLTNYAVNVKAKNFDGSVADDVGSKRTLQARKRRITSRHAPARARTHANTHAQVGWVHLWYRAEIGAGVWIV